jgi:hypothetical protein
MSEREQDDATRILERVRRMLAIANDLAATEGERDNALRMAHNLLAKHQLDMEDVDAHAREKLDPRVRLDGTSWAMAWTHHVRQSIAKLFMCRYYYGGKRNATQMGVTFIGRTSNVTTCAYMCDFIINSILKEGRKRFKHNLSPETRAFALGCATKLAERVSQLRAEKQRDWKSTGSALVVLDVEETEDAANEALIKEAGTEIVVSKDRSDYKSLNWSAFVEGNEYGKTIGLNTQVANKRGTLAIEGKKT